MTNEKFINDTKTVLKFIQIYCENKHKDANKEKNNLNLVYKDKDMNISLDYHLCNDCKNTLIYSYERLQECPHDEKPRCRKCPNPCYEKPQWKGLTKIMKYSGMKLGLIKVKKFLSLSK